MPFAPTTNPDVGAQLLYQGISQAGRTLGDALGDVLDKQKQQSRDRKLYLGLADSMVEGGVMTPLERGRLDNENTDTIKGYVEGKKFTDTLKQLRQQNQISQQQLETLNYSLQRQRAQDTAQAKFDELMRTRLAPAAAPAGAWTPAQGAAGPEGAAATTAAPLSEDEIYGMAAQAGLPLSKPLIETAEAFQRYGVPGTVTPLPGRPDLGFVWQGKGTGSVLPARLQTPSGTGAPTVTPSGTPGVAIFRDPVTGRSQPVKTDITAGLGSMGKIELDNARTSLASTDAEIANTLQQIQEKGSGAKVPILDQKGNAVGGGFLGLSTKTWTLQEKLNALMQKKATATATLQSLMNALPAPIPGTNPTNAPATAPARWRYDEPSGALVPVQ